VLQRKPLKTLNDGRKRENGRIREKQASVGKLVRSVPRVTAENHENGLTMGEKVETGDYRKNGQASENLSVRYHVLQWKPLKMA
jgi:hypothetical protein